MKPEPWPEGPEWQWARTLVYSPEKVRAWIGWIDDMLAHTDDPETIDLLERLYAKLALDESLIILIEEHGWAYNPERGWSDGRKLLRNEVVHRLCSQFGVHSSDTETRETIAECLDLPDTRLLADAISNYLRKTGQSRKIPAKSWCSLAERNAAENKALYLEDLESKTKAELEKLVQVRGLEVEGTGKSDEITRADLLKALKRAG